MMPIVDAILGVVLLFFGRSLYWAFVAVAGFLVGGQLAEIYLVDQAAWVQVLAALAAGVAGALLAMLAQRVAFAIGGFYAGSYLALLVAQPTEPESSPMLWLIVGGVIGAVIAALIMDWGIIVMSSLVGAGAVVVAMGTAPRISLVAYLLLFGVGVAFQSNRLRRSREMHQTPSSSDS